MKFFARLFGFAFAHKSAIAAAIAWGASLPLPPPYHAVASLVAIAAAAIAGTKYTA